VRGIAARRARWSDLLGRLDRELDRQAKTLEESEQRSLNLSATAFTLLGLFQVLLMVPGLLRLWDGPPALPAWWARVTHLADWALAAAFGLTMVMLWGLLRRLVTRLRAAQRTRQALGPDVRA
jgi:hypothetical protein